MRQDIFQYLFPIGTTADKIGRTRRPHDDAHRNQENRRIEKSHASIHTLCDRISEKSAIRNDRAVLEHLPVLLRVALKQHLVKRHTDKLQNKADRQQQPASFKNRSIK